MGMNNPEILWAQNTNKVFVTINIQSIINEWVDITEQKIHFRGENKENKYDLSIDLLHEVDILKNSWISNDKRVFITLEKKNKLSWVKLSTTKYNNLKIDWNRWEDVENEDLDSDQENMMNDFSNFKKTLPGELMNKDFTELFNKDLNTEISSDEENQNIESIEEECCKDDCCDINSCEINLNKVKSLEIDNESLEIDNESLEIDNELINRMEEGTIK